MSNKKFKEKYNDGCIKIFKLLELLYEDKAEYEDVIRIFAADEPDFERQHVTLNKFLNTLKIFGMKIQKSNKKFHSLNLPFAMDFTIDDLKSINMLYQAANSLPDCKTKESILNCVASLKTRFNEEAAVSFDNISSNDNRDYSFYYAGLREQIEKCEKFCNSNFKIHLTYLEDGNEVSTYCNAQQVVFDNKNAYLRIFKISERELKDVLLSNIIEIKYSPSAKTKNEVTKTVVFALKGRLANAYQLREHEYISAKQEDGSVVIVNSNEPVDSLLKRLMRYDSDCVILGPKELRIRMKELINNTLKNYE